ncbi:MAG: amidohydrolase [Candidatus Binataceae bacterium]
MEKQAPKPAVAPPGKADLVLHEGILLGHPGEDSVAISGGRIVARGKFADLKAWVGSRTYMIKLGGRTVTPGFIDSHLHFMEAAAAATGISVQRCRTVADLLAQLRLATGRVPPGNWLRAFGCDEALLFDRRGPTRMELDLALPKNPLRLRHQTLHASWLNSRAINLLGLEAPGFTPPPGAKLHRGDDGRLASLVAGMEEWLTSRLPRVTHAEAESRARVMSRELAAAGVTAFTDATVRNGAADAAMFAKFVQSGAICQRVQMTIGAPHLTEADEAEAIARAAGIGMAGVKFMPPHAHDRAELANIVKSALDRGLDCAFHATEVEELEDALATFEMARAQGAAPGARLRIEHGGVIPPDDIGRLAALDAWVVTNPGYVHFRGPKYAGEPGLIPHLYRARSLRAGGVHLAGATDAPVTPARPLAAIAAAISRASLDGKELSPAEALSATEAFGLFTIEGALLARLEAGAIEPGALADLVVLPRDPMAAGAADLMSMAADVTIIGGRVVYEHGRPPIAQSDTAELRNI